MKINGHTEIIAHIGYPTHSFKAPLIYNPYFESAGINALVVPMGCTVDHYPDLLRSVFRLENIRGALITMPAGRRALVVGSGGVGSAIAASLAQAGVSTLGLFDVNAASAQGLGQRLQQHYSALEVRVGSNDPDGFDLVVNATPMGMNAGDPLPMDVSRIAPSALVGEVVMRTEMTAFLAAARARGCTVQIGSDMLFEQIPAYLEFFGLPTTTPEVLRAVAQLGA